MLGLAKKRIWKSNPMKFSYDAVIIGGGLHGLATAYYLARNHGMQNVAIIEKRFIGFGGAGRNTAIVRANQRTQLQRTALQGGVGPLAGAHQRTGLQSHVQQLW